MKVLVTGTKGQLGFDVCNELTRRGIENQGIDRDECDITNKQAVLDYIYNYAPDVVVHCAAYTAVDRQKWCIFQLIMFSMAKVISFLKWMIKLAH